MYSRSTHITLLERLGGGVVVSDDGAEGGSKVVDHEAWRAFHDRYGDLIRGFARVRGVQPADCDDLVQEVMVSLARVMQKGFVYDPSKGSFRSYLKTTVIHAIARRARQNRPLTGIEEYDGRGIPVASATGGRRSAGLLSEGSDGAEGGDEAWEQQWRQHHTRLAMKTIESEFNATDLEAFQRYALMQHDAATVAQDLRISLDSVYQAKSRVLRRLSKLIADQIGEEGKWLRAQESAEPGVCCVGAGDPSAPSWFSDETSLLGEVRKVVVTLGDAPAIAGYTSLLRLKAGGQAVVYSATQASTGRRVAVKIVRADDDRARLRFAREIELAASLRHPHIVRVYDSGTTADGRVYLVMELIEGPSLERFAEGKGPREVAALMATVAEAVGYAHQRGVIHRDLKPDNILIDSEGQPRVVDFGLARAEGRWTGGSGGGGGGGSTRA